MRDALSSELAPAQKSLASGDTAPGAERETNVKHLAFAFGPAEARMAQTYRCSVAGLTVAAGQAPSTAASAGAGSVAAQPGRPLQRAGQGDAARLAARHQLALSTLIQRRQNYRSRGRLPKLPNGRRQFVIALAPVILAPLLLAASAQTAHADPIESAASPGRPAVSAPTDPSAVQAAFSGIFSRTGATHSQATGIPPPVSTPWWWSGICDSNRGRGGYEITSWDGLIACGPPETGLEETGPLAPNSEWQCVELSERWLYQEFHLPVQAPGGTSNDGWQIVNDYASYLQSHPGAAPLAHYTPSTAGAGDLGPGDVVSYGSSDRGHTNVVISVSLNSSGTGSMATLNQNYVANGTDYGVVQQSVTNWVPGPVSGVGAATGWLHYTGATPTAPVVVQAGGDQINDVELAWSASSGGSGGIASYKVFRDGVPIAVVPSSTLSLTDDSLPDGGILHYQVVAVDGAGRQSPPSNTVAVTVLAPGQSGQAWLGSTAVNGAQYCRRVGDGPDNVASYLACTTFNGSTFGPEKLSGVQDWGYGTGRAWIPAGSGKADFCRRVGDGPDNVASYLACTTFNGTTFGPEKLSGVQDWGYDTGWAWIPVGSGKVDYCRRVGDGPNNVGSYLACTTFNGTTFGPEILSGVQDWGYDTGWAWIPVGSGKVDYCRRVGDGPDNVGSYLACTTFNGTTFGPEILSGVQDWGYDAGADWVFAGSGKVDYCRRVGDGPDNVASYLACTVFNETTFGPEIMSGVQDWGYENGETWVSAPGGTTYCRLVGDGPNNVASYLACTTFNGTSFGPEKMSGVQDWGYPT